MKNIFWSKVIFCIAVFSTAFYAVNRSINQSDPEKQDLKTFEMKWTSDADFKYIEGKVENKTGKTYSIVFIEFPIYDKNGNRVGSAMDRISEFGPGTWKYKATVVDEAGVTPGAPIIQAFDGEIKNTNAGGFGNE